MAPIIGGSHHQIMSFGYHGRLVVRNKVETGGGAQV
jgi:hypothetical protein